MSRAGKFIPGGGSSKAKRTGPIRAPDPSAPPGEPASPSAGSLVKKTFGKGLVKPVGKGIRPMIAIMSAAVCCLLISAGWYFMAYQPAIRDKAAYAALIQKMKDDDAARIAAENKAKADEEAKLSALRGILTADSNPTGAAVRMGDFQGTTPVKFSSIIPGPYTLTIHLDGYEDYKQEVTIEADKPTDLGTIVLAQKTGGLALTSPQNNVTYKLTGPDGYSHEGQIPDKLDKLPIGNYSLTPSQGDWTLPPLNLLIRENVTAQKDVKFPYANVSITSVPSGATVREGRTVLGQTPLSLSPFRPRDVHLSIDLPPYTVQHVDLQVPDFGNVTKEIKLQPDKSFIAACGMPMVWIPDGGYWVAKYDFRQGDFEKVAGYNPSFFRGPNKPVETISWESAQAFIDKLNKYEAKAGKLPPGFHYSLPKETQWDQFNADANMDMAAMSAETPLTSTQDTGYSGPNKYGLYDTMGNVWEWCLDDFDEQGNHTLRGGTWLSRPENFPGPGTRQAGGLKYADKFIGFRVVLVPN